MMMTAQGVPRRRRGMRLRTLAFALGGALVATIGNAAAPAAPAAQECPHCWDEPHWRERVRPVYDAMREVFGTMNPPVLRGGGR